MRRFAPLIVVAILFILGGVGATYYARLKLQARSAPARPNALPPNIEAAAQDWTWTHMSGNRPVVSVRAKHFEEVGDKFLLNDVELHIFKKTSKDYDRVRSAKAEVDQKAGLLYSDGDVDITMGVPENGAISGRLMNIKSSGVHLEVKTGKAFTDRAASFSFDRGEGKSVGAEYDPNAHELQLKSQAELVWKGTSPGTKPMKIDAGNIVYKENDSKVLLGPTCKLTRDTLTMDAGPAVVTLKDGVIQLVEAQNAQGVDRQAKRNLDFAANQLTIAFDGDGAIQKITGVNNARLVSTAATGETRMTTDRIEMDFDTSTKDSTLQTALATGHSVVESKPAAKGSDTGEVRVLKSETIKTKMRTGGQEIESVETPGPGSLEFIPTKPGQPHRWMNGDQFWIAYGPENQIQTFKSVNVSTRTEKPAAPGAKQAPPPSLTWSKNLLAKFQPKSSQIDTLEQWADFRYEEGDRKAKAERAVLNQPKNIIELTGAARVWDPTGSADADHITLDQKSGDFTAEGNVSSTRMPDKKKNESTGMLSQDEPLHAKARKMFSTDNNLKIRYDGNVMLWQGANRLQADMVEIDRDEETLKAHGHVVSQLMDKQDGKKTAEPTAAAKAKKAAGPPVFSIVHAPELIYTDDDRLAYYKGGVILDRGGTRVKSRELRAFLRDQENDSSLDHAVADGAVEIVNTMPDRTRTGRSEHAEYFVDQDKVVLEGGEPQFTDVLQGKPRGTTRGKQLIWYSKDDRLLVNGAIGQPAQSNLRRK